MKRNVIVVAAVVVAIAAVLTLKGLSQQKASNVSEASPPRANHTANAQQAHHTVLLFADPREAESSCGCAEVIRLARATAQQPGVHFAEHDPRTVNDEVSKLGVRVSPTVVILGADGGERQRFEGESQAMIAQLREALGALGEGEKR